GRELFTLEGFLGGVFRVAFSPDGKYLAAATGDRDEREGYPGPGEVCVWDLARGNLVWNLRGHPGCVWSVVFSPDGKRLASAGGVPGRRPGEGPGEVRFWDVQTGQELCTLTGHKTRIRDLAFSPCGRR